MASQRVCVTAGVASFDIADGRLGYERPEARFVGFVLEVHKLLVGDGQLGPQTLEPLAHVDKPPLEDRLGHGTGSLRPGTANPMRSLLSVRMGVWTSRARSSLLSTTSCAPPSDGSSTRS